MDVVSTAAPPITNLLTDDKHGVTESCEDATNTKEKDTHKLGNVAAAKVSALRLLYIKRTRTAETIRQDVMNIINKQNVNATGVSVLKQLYDSKSEMAELLAEDLASMSKKLSTRTFTAKESASIKLQHDNKISRAEDLIQELMGILLKPNSNEECDVGSVKKASSVKRSKAKRLPRDSRQDSEESVIGERSENGYVIGSPADMIIREASVINEWNDNVSGTECHPDLNVFAESVFGDRQNDSFETVSQPNLFVSTESVINGCNDDSCESGSRADMCVGAESLISERSDPESLNPLVISERDINGCETQNVHDESVIDEQNPNAWETALQPDVNASEGHTEICFDNESPISVTSKIYCDPQDVGTNSRRDKNVRCAELASKMHVLAGSLDLHEKSEDCAFPGESSADQDNEVVQCSDMLDSSLHSSHETED